MKPTIKHPCNRLAKLLALALQLFTIHCSLFTATAAVPLAWDVEPRRATPAKFDRYHGETLDLTATFRGFGELPFAPGADVRLYFQTNGMGSAWWNAPASVSSNVVTGTFSPSLDPGADSVTVFFGAPSNAYASAIIKLRPSPGFSPAAMPAPGIAGVVSLENYYTKDETDARLLELARDLSWAASAGNTRLVSTDGTTWQDATGTVWQVTNVYGWAGTVIDLASSTARPIVFTYYGTTTNAPNTSGVETDYWSAGGGTNLFFDTEMANCWTIWFVNGYNGSGLPDENFHSDGGSADSISATNLTFTTLTELYSLFYRPVALATNPVDRVLYESGGGGGGGEPGNYAAVSNAAMSAAAQTNDFLRLTGGSILGPIRFPYLDDYGVAIWPETPGALTFRSSYPDYSGISAYLDLSRIPTNDTGFGSDEIAYLSDIPSPPDLTPYATKSALQSVSNIAEEVRTESALVYRLYSGSNVVAEVTNYNSQVHAPSLRLMQLNESNEYVTVWTETKGLARTFRDATNYTDGAIAAYAAPRAWSRTTSGLGSDAPQGTTWISTPRTVIAGGFEYAKIVDTYGEVWVLSSNGMGMDFNPDTNAYFRITADDGTPVFSIEKADAQVVGAYAEGITVSANSVTMPVPVVSAEAPTMYWSAAFESGVWADQSSPPTGATVNWSGSAGTWVCTVTFSGARPSKMFFRFSFLQEGGVVIRNNATTDLSSGIWVNGTKFVPSVSGNNLIWTKQ